MKRKIPVALSGGTGFRYENPVAARFLLDLLAGTNSLGGHFGRIYQVDWQARDNGWLADDLVVSCKHTGGDRCAAISVKSHQQVTRNGFPAEFVEIAWRQWLGIDTQRNLREDSDAIVLITGRLADEVDEAWSRLHRELLETSPERMVARLAAPDGDLGSQSSSVQRELFASFHCPDELRGHGDSDAATTARLLRHVGLLHFDYEEVTSRDDQRAIADCQRVLRVADPEHAQRLWQRLVGIADEKRPRGATLNLSGLLEELRGAFDLRDHPDYETDWELLQRASDELMADIRTGIADLLPLPRQTDRATIQQSLDDTGTCFLVGESGCGKSALAKETAHERYRRVVWINENTLDYDTSVHFQQAAGLSHPLHEVLSALPEPCLVVFDSIERYAKQALRLAAHLSRDVLASPGPRHIHFLFTAQFETADSVIRRLVEFGVPLSALTPTTIARPSETDVHGLVAVVPQLQWASLRPELRSLLTNLKVLDWVVAAAQAGQAIDGSAFMGLTALIDALWERWVEDGGNLDRSHLLMRLGILEAETLSAGGVARVRLDPSQQQALAAVAASDLVRIRDERVRFTHDLLGDWARMRVLLGEGPLSSPASRDRSILPRWHRAVRLFGQRLLEQSADGCDQWQRALGQADDGSPGGSILRDLFLESVFLATDARALLERTWPALSANNGKLLNRLLKRFLYVATLPDPRLPLIMQGEGDTAQWEHLMRLPYWPYWLPVLTVLHAHRAEVATLAPHNAASICALWLRSIPAEIAPGFAMPCRHEAAELSLAIGREIQALNAEGNYFSDGLDKVAYEAVLWAAPELPSEIGALSLELAERRDPAPEIRARVEQAHEEQRERQRQWLAANPERARRRPPPSISWHGSRRAPWPDGPRDRVQSCFQEACLDTGAFAALVRADANVALEVLLAVCVEDPQYDDHSHFGECGLDVWQQGDPPLWCRGPFVSFLREAPEQGLSAVLRLTNFATLRYTNGHDGLTIMVDGQPRNWRGDGNVFRWHHDWPLHNGAAVECALMALERWLYEQIDLGVNIEPWIARILAESESLAFAGLLMDVGKRSTSLFEQSLMPLLRNWVIVDWDRQVSMMRRQGMSTPGFWGSQPAQVIQLGREWYGLPHRSNILIAPDGPLLQTLLCREEFAPFLQQLRAEWSAELDADGEPESLRLLIARFDPVNYTFATRDGKRVLVDFQWPESIARENDARVQEISEESRLTTLPHQCRRWLDAGTPLAADQVAAFWQFVRSTDSSRPELPTDSGEPLLHIEDVLCAGIAILIVFHHRWLLEDPERMAWCRQTLEAIAREPPSPLRFDSEMAMGSERRWDAFAAECGVTLLAKNPDDPLARTLVATGIMSYHYKTTALTMVLACQRREELGDEFDRMLGLAVRWAGLRPPYARATRPQLETQSDVWRARKDALAQEFIERRLPTEYPDFDAINARAFADVEAVHAEQFSELSPSRRSRRSPRRQGQSREKLYPDTLSLDTRVISAAFAWLDLRSARSIDERRKWLGFVKAFLSTVLQLVPVIEDWREQEIDGLPSDFDSWVFGVVASTIPCLTADEDRRALWQPILDLGTPAHEWVERFFWHWFSDGLGAAPSPQAFTQLWSTMISHALDSPLWDPGTNRTYDLDDMVFELLGFDTRWSGHAQNATLAPAIQQMEPLFARAAVMWFGMPKIVNGFIYFATQPAAAPLLLPGIAWVAARLPSFDSYDWRHGLQGNVIAFLHACWARESDTISGTPALNSAFLTLLTTVVSRGDHAAIALRDRVVASRGA